MWTSENTLYLDMDGVLADFDRHARIVCDDTEPSKYEEKHGTEAFWNKINSDRDFFLNLEYMVDARELYDAVKHLEPVILTGIPRGMDPHDNQKILWSKKKFGHQQRIICCQASKKHTFMKAKGDILIDDRFRNMKKWDRAGGIFVLHKSAIKSIQSLKMLGVIK
jgi:hypothetical protein